MAHTDLAVFMDKNSERYQLARRIDKIIKDLRGKYLFPDSETVNGFLFRDGQYSYNQLNEGEWRAFNSETEFWGYPECYAWFKHSFTVPARFAGKPVWYEAMPFPHGSWEGTNPQLIVFANGKLMQGMDSHHREVQLLKTAVGGETYDVAINAHTDAFAWRGPVQMQARLKVMDELVLKLIFDLQTPLEVSRLYSADDLPRVDIVKSLTNAVNVLDFNTRDYDTFADSAKHAMAILEAEIYGNDDPQVTAHCIGHTHIDVAWLWRLRQTRDKAGRSFATVLKYMEQYPEYKFMSSQAQLYDYVKQDYPEVYERIRERIKEGRWEAEGSMWVEADTNVTSGESLVRQFLIGKRFFKEEFGVDNKVMWLPDVFGYSAALPQIMKRAGIDFFMTTKISWNEYNKVPYDTFNWQGIDGSEVLAHFVPSTSGSEPRSFQTTYNAYLKPSEIFGGWKRYSQKDLNKDFLVTYGYGDGGGGPTLEMLEYGRRMEKGIPGLPRTKQTFGYDYFKQLECQVQGSSRLPKWSGELYLEFHRGTLTAQASNKKYNRKSELLYHDLETLGAIAATECQKAYPREQLNEGWKIILLNQFHDIIPGSSIKEVYDDSKIQYEAILKEGGDLLADTLAAITNKINLDADALVVFNTFGAARSDVVCTDWPQLAEFAIFDSDGAELPYQKTLDGKLLFFAKDVPAKGYKAFRLAAQAPAAQEALEAGTAGVETPYLSAEFDGDMYLSKLVHKQSGRAVAPQGESLGRLLTYQDKPFNHDAWDVKAYYEQVCEVITDVQAAKLVENGPVRAVVEVQRKFYESTITQRYLFYKALDRVDVAYAIDWKEKDIILKADYPVDVNTTRATFDIQFGNLERNTHTNTLWDFAQFEVVGHKWVDLSDNSFGLSVLNDCKYGNTIKQGRIQPTLLRCATDPNWAQDREYHEFTYSLYPHEGRVSDSAAVAHGYSLNLPLYCRQAGKQAGTLADCYSLVTGDKDNVVIETAKIAEDSDAVVLRCYETWNRRTPATLHFAKAPKAVWETNLLEEKEAKLSPVDETLTLTLQPFEIKTLLVEF